MRASEERTDVSEGDEHTRLGEAGQFQAFLHGLEEPAHELLLVEVAEVHEGLVEAFPRLAQDGEPHDLLDDRKQLGPDVLHVDLLRPRVLQELPLEDEHEVGEDSSRVHQLVREGRHRVELVHDRLEVPFQTSDCCLEFRRRIGSAERDVAQDVAHELHVHFGVGDLLDTDLDGQVGHIVEDAFQDLVRTREVFVLDGSHGETHGGCRTHLDVARAEEHDLVHDGVQVLFVQELRRHEVVTELHAVLVQVSQVVIVRVFVDRREVIFEHIVDLGEKFEYVLDDKVFGVLTDFAVRELTHRAVEGLDDEDQPCTCDPEHLLHVVQVECAELEFVQDVSQMRADAHVEIEIQEKLEGLGQELRDRLSFEVYRVVVLDLVEQVGSLQQFRADYRITRCWNCVIL